MKKRAYDKMGSNMGVIINNNDNQSDLQRRITSDLREKQEKRASGAGKKKVAKPDFVKAQTDFVTDSSYMHDFAKSSIPGWVWAFGLIIAIVIAALIANAILSSGGSR